MGNMPFDVVYLIMMNQQSNCYEQYYDVEKKVYNIVDRN